MTTTTTQIPKYDRDAFRRRVSYVRDLETLLPVMSDELRAAVTAWRAAHTEGIAALDVLFALDNDRAFKAAAAADVEAAEAAIAAGNYGDPLSTHMDMYAVKLRAAIREADHKTGVAYELHTRLVELAAGPTPFRPMDAATVKTVTTALGKISDAGADLDMRAAFLAWVPQLTAAYGRQDTSAPTVTGGPASAAIASVSGLIATLAASGVDTEGTTP